MSDYVILNKRRSNFFPSVPRGALAVFADSDSTLKAIDAQGNIGSVGGPTTSADITDAGQPGGVATLDESARLPASQVPEVLEAVVQSRAEEESELSDIILEDREVAIGLLNGQPSSIYVGDGVTEGGKWLYSKPLVKRVTGLKSMQSNSTLEVDSALDLPLPAGSWLVTYNVMFMADDNAVPKVKITGGTLFSLYGPYIIDELRLVQPNNTSGMEDYAPPSGFELGGGLCQFVVHAHVTLPAPATLQFQWAQNVSVADTLSRVHSTMIAQRIA